MQIAFFETNPEEQKTLEDLLKPLGNVQMSFFPEPIKPTNLEQIQTTDALCVFIHSKVDKTILDGLPNLKLIATRSTGFDHIDVACAKTKNISVCNVPSYGSRTVAEFTFSLILGLARKTFLAYRQVKNNHDFDISHFQGFDLQGKTLGVVGTGKIGQNVIKIAKAFEMKVLAFDLFENSELAKTLEFEYKNLDAVLRQSDVLTLHVPYNKETHHLINLQNIKLIKPGAILVNTARGEVVETDALVWAIQEKILSGVGLDVLEGEKELCEECVLVATQPGKNPACAIDFKLLLEDHMLINQPETAITPHIAFFSKEAKHEILQTTSENISNFLNGKPKNFVG